MKGYIPVVLSDPLSYDFMIGELKKIKKMVQKEMHINLPEHNYFDDFAHSFNKHYSLSLCIQSWPLWYGNSSAVNFEKISRLLNKKNWVQDCVYDSGTKVRFVFKKDPNLGKVSLKFQKPFHAFDLNSCCFVIVENKFPFNPGEISLSDRLGVIHYLRENPSEMSHAKILFDSYGPEYVIDYFYKLLLNKYWVEDDGISDIKDWVKKFNKVNSYNENYMGMY